MKYITFLGDLTYSPIEYQTEKGPLTISYFQLWVLSHYPEIDEMYLITTQKVKDNPERYDVFIQEMENNYPNLSIITILMEQDNYYDAIRKLQQQQNLKGKVILDVTHSFRSIPFRVMLTNNYMETALNIQIEHIFYGKIDTAAKTGEAVDIYGFYNDSKIADSLRQFRQTLKLQQPQLIYENDNEIKRMIQDMSQLNYYLEMADYKRSLSCIQRIYTESKRIFDSGKYLRLRPYLESIIDEFEHVALAKNKEIETYEFVELLLKHNYYQVASTFVCYHLENWMENVMMLDNRDTTYFFKFINDKYKVILKDRKLYMRIKKEDVELTHSNLYDKIKKCYEKDDFYIENLSEEEEHLLVPKFIELNAKAIKNFKNKVRNNYNHGLPFDNNISQSKKIQSIIHDANDAIKELYEFSNSI